MESRVNVGSARANAESSPAESAQGGRAEAGIAAASETHCDDRGADQAREGGPRAGAAATIDAGAALGVAAASATLVNSPKCVRAGRLGGAAAPVAPPMQHSDSAQ